MAEADQPPDPGGSDGVGDGSRPRTGHSGARSFAVVTKIAPSNRFPIIRLAPRQYGTKDGKPSVSFSPAELQAGVDNLKHALVAKFSIGRPHIEEIRQAFMAAWGLGGKCSIGALDARHILIVLDSELEARKVLAHPTRKIGYAFFRVFRWTKDFDTKKESPVTSSWIRLMNLPPGMFNQGYIEPIVASFSRFLAIDIKTATLSNPCFARVCVELDTTSTLPDAVWINIGGDGGFWQNIVYEGHLLFCSRCNLHGHSLDTCRKTLKRRLEEQQIWEGRDAHGLPSVRSSTNVVAGLGNKPDSTAREVLSSPSPNPQGAVPKLKQDDVQSLSLPILAQTTHADNAETEWKLVQKRKGKNKFWQQALQPRLPQRKAQVSHPHQTPRTVELSTSEQNTAAAPTAVPIKQVDPLHSSNHDVLDVHTKTDDVDVPSTANQAPNVPDGNTKDNGPPLDTTRRTLIVHTPRKTHKGQASVQNNGHNMAVLTSLSSDEANTHIGHSIVQNKASFEKPIEEARPEASSKDVAGPCSILNPNNNKPDYQLVLYSSPGRDHEDTREVPEEGAFQASKALATILNKVRNDPRRSGRVNAKKI